MLHTTVNTIFRCSMVFSCIFAIGVDLAESAPRSQLDADQIKKLTAENIGPAVELYRDFLGQPNDANSASDILALIEWMEPQFARRDFDTSRIATAGSPALYAERIVPGAQKTVLIYLQADGQPVDRTAWNQPDPFDPVLKKRSGDGDWQIIPWESLQESFDPEWRIFARSAADSKGPMTQFLLAMDALAKSGIEPAFNMKVIIDTEEELGSPNLAAAIKANEDRLAADMLLIFDGPPHASNKPTVTFGARGIATVTLTAYGPLVPQHSGHYGNFVANPAMRLSRLLASMTDADGRVVIEGYYDGVSIDDATRKQLARVPDDEQEILHNMGQRSASKVASSLQESLQYPSLNIRGLRAAWIGSESRTIIPATAVAEIDVRLVKESDPQRLLALIRQHIIDQGFAVLDHAPTDQERMTHDKLVSMTSEISYGAFRSDFDAAAGRLARAGMINLYGEEPLLIRTMGGSIPIAPIVDLLGIPAAIVPTVNMDNNQHSPNENLRLGSFLEGISIMTSVLSGIPDE